MKTCLHVLLLLCFPALLADCRTTTPDDCEDPNQPGCGLIPAVCTSDVTVTALTLDENQAGELAAPGETSFTVNVELEEEIPGAIGDPLALICFAVRDSGVVRGLPLTFGWVIVRPGDSTGVREDAFRLACDNNNNVAGRVSQDLPLGGGANLSDNDRSSGERSTRIFVQHAEGVRTLGRLPVGIRGERSDRIRVSCPR